VSNLPWPGVRRKIAKGRTYFYWARTDPWTRLPDPYTDPDGFMRKMAHLQRMGALDDERRRTGTFGGLVTDYRRSKHFREKLSANTRTVYDRYLKRLLVAYADAPLREMTPEDIQKRVLDANEDTPGAANAMLGILRTLFAYARKRHRGLEDWTAGLEQFARDEENERQPWPEDMLQAALTSDDELFRRAVMLALYTGQRPGDVCSMTWGMVAGDMIRVRQQKTKTALEIPMHPDLKAMIDRLPRSDRHLFLLSNKRGAPLDSRLFLRWCWDFSRARGLNRTPHGLRKNATIELFELGCTTAEVASITGHKSLAMLEHYGKGRSQPKIARVAMGKWQTKPKQEREN
jgi:integrase